MALKCLAEFFNWPNFIAWKEFFCNWAIPGLFFFIVVFSGLQLTYNYVSKILLPMSRFEPWISGVGCDHSANCATTTALGRKEFVNFTETLEEELPSVVLN